VYIYTQPGATSFGIPSAVYTGFSGLLIAFVTGTNGELYDTYWNGAWWVWERQYNPGTNVSSPSAVFQHNAWFGRIVVFVRGDNGHLYDKYMTDFGWVWEDQQTPPGGAGIVAPLSAIFQPTLNRLHVFVAGTDGHLYVKYWDGGWKWQDQQFPQ
jgi:hypothetical protein